MVENGQYRFYTCAKDYYYIDKYAFDTEALLISGNGAYVGYIHYYKGKFNAYQRTYVLDQFTENIQYIKVYLDEFLSKRINSEKKEGNTPYIVLSTLSDMKIKLINSNDESKVINTFNNINIKINKEELKLNKLIELKKGLMQNMFVQSFLVSSLFKKGLSSKIFSTLDVIKEEKLGNICNITTGKLDANAMVENGQYRFYTCAKDYYYIDKYAFDTEALLISGNGAYVGYIHYYKGKFNAYQRTYVLDQFTENIQYIKVYLDEFLSKRIISEKKEGNTPYIVLSTLSDMTIKLTNSKDENNVINTFNNINTKINKEEVKLNKLIELKKGLMQSMFVQSFLFYISSNPNSFRYTFNSLSTSAISLSICFKSC